MDALVFQRWSRWFIALLCCACLGLPFLRIEIPPILDLPQQVAQVRLFQEAVSDPSSPYRIEWWGPNNLSYLLIGFSWIVTGPMYAGRLAVFLLGASWVLALQGLAWKRERPVSGAVLASLFFFSHSLYMGYLSFAAGFPAFLLWFAWTAKDPSARASRWRDFLLGFVGCLLLYLAHILWMGAGVFWFVLISFVGKHSRRTVLCRGIGVLVVVVLAGAWYYSAPRGDYSMGIRYRPPPLGFDWLPGIVNLGFGGLRGWLEPATSAALVLWVTLAIWGNRNVRGNKPDMKLLGAGALFLAMGLLLPTSVGRILHFGARWFPVGCALVLLALPPLRVRSSLRRTLAVTILWVFCLVTSAIWRDFDREDLAGFKEAMQEIPGASAVLGLDYYRTSPRLKTYPFFQLYAYSQVLHGGMLHSSFAGHPSSLVQWRDVRLKHPWTENLDWHPDSVRLRDFAYFDFVLVHANPEGHRNFLAQEALAPVTRENRWRLYRVDKRRVDSESDSRLVVPGSLE